MKGTIRQRLASMQNSQGKTSFDREGYPLIYIDWIDSQREGGWTISKDLLAKHEPDLNVCSVGWLLRLGEKSVMIASHLAVDPEQVDGVLSIPYEAILGVKRF